MSRERGDVYRDTACFSDRQWFVHGFDHAFSTQKDAENAWRLAGSVRQDAQMEIADKIRDMLP